MCIRDSHYNMPAYSTGEARGAKSTNRREYGHGALAERALLPVLPSVEEFPYAIRVVSEVLSSNGSTSQGSVCGSTLALMDAGVPIKAPVAGISCGLIQDDDGSFNTFIDIQGVEDFHGEMDFKVAGTKAGITAIQMDLKNDGLTMELSLIHISPRLCSRGAGCFCLLRPEGRNTKAGIFLAPPRQRYCEACAINTGLSVFIVSNSTAFCN